MIAAAADVCSEATPEVDGDGEDDADDDDDVDGMCIMLTPPGRAAFPDDEISLNRCCDGGDGCCDAPLYACVTSGRGGRPRAGR